MFEARFQTFDDPQPAQTGPRVQALRAELARRGLAGFIVPRADRHQNEYVPAVRGAARLADRLHRLGRRRRRAGRPRRAVRRRPLHAAGARRRSTPRCSRSCRLAETPPERWLEQNLPAGGKLGYDPWLHTADGAERLAQGLRQGRRDARRRPSPIRSTRSGPTGRRRRSAPVVLHDLRFAGEDAADKLDAHPRRDREAARRRAGDLRSAHRRLDLQHPRRRRRAYAAAARLRHRAAGGPADALSRRPQAHQRGARTARRARRGARARRRSTGDLAALGAAQAHRAARSGDRRRRAGAHHRPRPAAR